MTSFVFIQTIYIFGIANNNNIKKKVILSQEYKKKHYFLSKNL